MALFISVSYGQMWPCIWKFNPVLLNVHPEISMYIFSAIFQCWNGTGRWKHPLCKTRQSCIISIIVADDLTMQSRGESISSRGIDVVIQVSAPILAEQSSSSKTLWRLSICYTRQKFTVSYPFVCENANVASYNQFPLQYVDLGIRTNWSANVTSPIDKTPCFRRILDCAEISAHIFLTYIRLPEGDLTY